MLDVLEDHDVTALPLRNVGGVRGERLPVFREEHVKHAGAAEIDVRIRLRCYGNVASRVGGDICIDHGLQIVTGFTKRTPHRVGAGTTIGRRVAALIIVGVIGRVIFGILTGTGNNICIVVHTVAVEINRAGGFRILAIRLISRHDI